MMEFVRADELLRAIALLPEASKGPRVVEIPVEPFRESVFDRPDVNETRLVHTVRFRKEAFGHGSRRWSEYVLDLPARAP